jgi:hypothetical protein
MGSILCSCTVPGVILSTLPAVLILPVVADSSLPGVWNSINDWLKIWTEQLYTAYTGTFSRNLDQDNTPSYIYLFIYLYIIEMCSSLIKYILSLMTICLQRKINLLNDIGQFFLLSSRHIEKHYYFVCCWKNGTKILHFLDKTYTFPNAL